MAMNWLRPSLRLTALLDLEFLLISLENLKVLVSLQKLQSLNSTYLTCDVPHPIFRGLTSRLRKVATADAASALYPLFEDRKTVARLIQYSEKLTNLGLAKLC